ncbi:AAA family ATPase [Azospira sp. I09]|uniref:AAA family ATPase n=1 Tax=Azospira sp. I09 TaxID=1765049 RepID=UPI0012604299|nr:AAA family ATPase [Azospira sp. I09]BBN89717.1 hypothetical protein AZSP09_27400 [Azospira sp. I09]
MASKLQLQPLLSSHIRFGSNNDLADACTVAARHLTPARGALDNIAFEFSKDLFVAVSLHLVYSQGKQFATVKDVLEFIADPGWEDPRQTLLCLQQEMLFGQQELAVRWIQGFTKKALHLPSEIMESLMQRCISHWQSAFGTAGATGRHKKPRHSVQVFNPELVEQAAERMAGLDSEKRGAAGRSLQNARHNQGYRTIPNAGKAHKKLDAAKCRFENLGDPISRLQMDLVLSAAMKPQEFNITPVLLLGDPGVGKTYFATQLAEALGVPTDKISAGGAQGGFQITGSHTSWRSARPGSVFTILAEGQSASPVIVVDEVDKIADGLYPVLPALLDLLEPNTGRRFKDEFFEMEFDASRAIVVLTANSLLGVPTPLLSRVEVFEVPRPDLLQRRRIIECHAELLRLKTWTHIHLDKDGSARLAERDDLDLRKTTRLVKEAFANALLTGETVAKLVLPKSEARRSIGFGM